MGRVRDSRDLPVYLLRSAGARARGRARRQGVRLAPSLLKEPSTTLPPPPAGHQALFALTAPAPAGMRGEGDGRGRTGDSDVTRPLSTQPVRGSAFFQAPVPGCAGCVLLTGALSWGDLV